MGLFRVPAKTPVSDGLARDPEQCASSSRTARVTFRISALARHRTVLVRFWGSPCRCPETITLGGGRWYQTAATLHFSYLAFE
jgi:hypothetical protein